MSSPRGTIIVCGPHRIGSNRREMAPKCFESDVQRRTAVEVDAFGCSLGHCVSLSPLTYAGDLNKLKENPWVIKEKTEFRIKIVYKCVLVCFFVCLWYCCIRILVFGFWP